MSDLTAFRDHARRLSTAVHGDACEAIYHRRDWSGGLVPTRAVKPDPDCPGCVTDSDRQMWARLADEIDAYLTGDPDVVHPTAVPDDLPLEGL